MRWHLLHPAAVHFPIALLVAGGAARAASASKRAPAWLETASTWLLWLGTLAAWVALGLGQLAEETAAHVPPAWLVLYEHQHWAWWTASVFTAASALAWRLRRKPSAAPARGALALLWLAGLILILRTAFLGGELVFRYGMGVGSADDSVEDPASP